MKTTDLQDLLLDYVYEELDANERAAFEAALADNAEVQAELAAIQATRELFGALEEQAVPPALSASLMAEAAKAVPAPETPGLLARIHSALSLLVMHPAMSTAAVMVVVAGVSLYVYRYGGPPSAPGPGSEGPILFAPGGRSPAIAVESAGPEPGSVQPGLAKEDDQRATTTAIGGLSDSKQRAPQAARGRLGESRPRDEERDAYASKGRDPLANRAQNAPAPSPLQSPGAPQPAVVASGDTNSYVQRRSRAYGNSVGLKAAKKSGARRRQTPINDRLARNDDRSAETKTRPWQTPAPQAQGRASGREALAPPAAQPKPMATAPRRLAGRSARSSTRRDSEGALRGRPSGGSTQRLASGKAGAAKVAVASGSPAKDTDKGASKASGLFQAGQRAVAGGRCSEALDLFTRALASDATLRGPISASLGGCRPALASSSRHNWLATQVAPAIAARKAARAGRSRAAKKAQAQKKRAKSAPARVSKPAAKQ